MKHLKIASLLFFCVHFIFGGTSWADESESILNLPIKAAEGFIGNIFNLGSIVAGDKRLASPFGNFVANATSSTTVVTQEDIERRGARNLPQALEEVPGVVLGDLTGNGEEPTLDFRGYNEGQDFVFLLDGVRLNEPKSNNINYPLIPVSLIERIEVSRGGASFLYGEGAMGGVANVVSVVPKEEGVRANVKSQVGSFGEWWESGNVSLKEGPMSIFLTADLYHIQGFRENTSVEKENLYMKLNWQATERFRWGLSYLYADAYLDRSGSIREALLRQYGRQATERPRNFSDMDTQLGIFDYAITPIESVVISGNVFGRQTSELSVANFATFVRDDNELDLVADTWGFTVQADHSKDLFWNLVEGFLIGVDYVENAIDEEDFRRSKATLRRLGTSVDSESNKDSLGIFAKGSLSWSEKVGVHYGARYDQIDFKNTDRINLNNNATAHISKYSQSVGASFQPYRPLSLSALYSNSFRSPTLADLYANPAFGGNPGLKPEESSDYEIGAKWTEKTWMISSTFFLNHLKNEIGFDPNITDAIFCCGRNSNFGKTERRGFENFVQADLTSWFSIKGSHTYMDAFFKSNDPDDPFFPTGIQKSGHRIPMVPRNRLASSLIFKPVPELNVNLSMISLSKQVLTNDLDNERNGRRLPAYTVFNFKTIYQFRGWEFGFEIKNLLNERYEAGGSVGLAPSPFVTDLTLLDNFLVPAPGRSYAGTVSYSW